MAIELHPESYPTFIWIIWQFPPQAWGILTSKVGNTSSVFRVNGGHGLLAFTWVEISYPCLTSRITAGLGHVPRKEHVFAFPAEHLDFQGGTKIRHPATSCANALAGSPARKYGVIIKFRSDVGIPISIQPVSYPMSTGHASLLP
jgi:hypothetical protein